MNIQAEDFRFHRCEFPTVRPDGTEYRHCYSTRASGNFGFAVWHEQSDGHTLVMDDPEYVESREAARQLAQERSDDFRKSFPPCTYHQVIVGRAEFASAMMSEEHQTLEGWVSAQGLDQSDFAITTYRKCYRLAFRSMNSKVEAALLFLRLWGVLSRNGLGNFVTDTNGRLEDLPGYKP